jgi:hypothetical protein
LQRIQPELSTRQSSNLRCDLDPIVTPAVESKRDLLPCAVRREPGILVLKWPLLRTTQHLNEEVSRTERIGLPHVLRFHPATNAVTAVRLDGDFLAQADKLPARFANVFEADRRLAFLRFGGINSDFSRLAFDREALDGALLVVLKTAVGELHHWFGDESGFALADNNTTSRLEARSEVLSCDRTEPPYRPVRTRG